MQLMIMWRALALLAAPVLASAERGTALQKVVEMLTSMAHKAKQMKNEEEVSFAKFNEWCGNEKARLDEQIKKEASELEKMQTESAKLTADAKELGEAVATLQTDVAGYDAELKAQASDREKGHKDFLAEQQDYGESVDALERAIVVLQSKSADVPAAASLLQASNLPGMPDKIRAVIETALELTGAGVQGASRRGASLLEHAQAGRARQEPSPLDYEAPEANAYEFQSGGIVEMLKRLKDEFISKKSEVEKEEMNAQHAFEMVRQDLTTSIENAKDSIGTKSALKSDKQSKAAELTKQAASLAEVKASDEKLFSDTKVECAEKSESFEEKQQLRAEEIQALEKAIDILSSDEVASGATHLALPQRGARATALAQLAGGGASKESTVETGIRRKVREFLLAQSQRLHSKNLGLLAQRMEADPFAKVKKMIEEMITRLNQEAHEDAEHEGFCDKEMGASKVTRNKLSETIDGLTADVENGKATIAMLTKEIAELEQDVSELQAAMKESTDLRFAEKKKNEETVSDAVDASKAVAAAVAVLKDFYKKASSATGFAQLAAGQPYGASKKEAGGELGVSMGSEEWKLLGTDEFDKMDKGHKKGMQTFGAVYQGQQDEAGGVLAMLDVIASDFATLKADTESAEAIAAKAYEDFMNEAKKDIAVKTRKTEMNAQDKVSTQTRLNDDVADLKFTQDKLLAADRYYETLVPQCLDKGMTFGERAKARKEEIESLKQALEILSSEDVA
jgi:uncharacterized protein YoxC